MLQLQHHEAKKVTSACWACPFGSKVVVGYSNGEIFIWSIPSNANPSTEASNRGSQNVPICKLNLAYKTEKNPIASLKWAYADGKASRLYVMGASNSVSVNLLQVFGNYSCNIIVCQWRKYAYFFDLGICLFEKPIRELYSRSMLNNFLEVYWFCNKYFCWMR